jgi:ABC-2 type transport system ATP-binding protein
VRTLGTLIAPSSGSARVAGLAVSPENGVEIRKRIAIMPESPGLYVRLSVLENLECFADLYEVPEPRSRIDRALRAVNLVDRAHDACGTLSKGLRQRVALARALLSDPEVLFLDEPTAGLDPHARHATWDLVRDLRADGVTVVMTTHFMEEAERLADQVVVVDAGRVIASGTPRALMSRGARNTLRFSAPGGLPVDTLQAELPAASTVREIAAGNYLVEGAVDPQLLATVTAWCAARGVMPEGLAVERRTLEDVFLELTGRALRS